MPRLWTETIDAHRHTVRETVMETAWALATTDGLMSVTMSKVAKASGIGRATLYKYFPDVEAILSAHHERHVTAHLEQLAVLRDQPGTAGARLEKVLSRYAQICHHRGRHSPEELSALVHQGAHVTHAQQQLIALFRDLIAEAAVTGEARDDVAPDELAGYCLHSLGAAGTLPSEAAVHRLVAVTLTGLRDHSDGERPGLTAH